MAVVEGGPKPSRFYVERMALTRSPATPTVPGAGGAPLRTSNQAAGQIDPGVGNSTAGDGLVLAGLYAVSVSIYPGVPGGASTLSGGGNLLCWVFNTYQGAWTRCDDLDIDMGSTSGYPAYTKATFHNVSRLGMLINWLTSSVTATAPDVLVRLDGFQSASQSST